MIKDIKENVDVSIVAANFNHASFLDEFFDSIVNSSVLPLELIIVDDGSTDASKILLEKYTSIPFLKIIKWDHNKGFATALNEGIIASSAKYIMRVDTDDLVDSDRIRKQYYFLKNNSDVDIIGTNIKYISTEKRTLFYSKVPLKHNTIVSFLRKGDIPMFNGTLMGKTSVFKDILFNPELLYGEDYDFFVRLILKGYKVENLSESLTNYRIHSENTSQNDLLLKYKKNAKVRHKYFGLKTSMILIYRNYLHTKLYRKYLYLDNNPIRFLFLALAACLRPLKIFNRLIPV